MYLKLGILAFAGLGAGAVIAAGIFAFLAIIGVFPRLIGVTHTAEHVILYETLLILVVDHMFLALEAGTAHREQVLAAL